MTMIKLLRQKKHEMQYLMKKEGQKAITDAFRTFFKDNPEIKGVSWTQYTPLYNDGEPCKFSVNEFLYTREDIENPKDVTGYDLGGFFDSWAVQGTPLETKINDFRSQFYSLDDLFEMTFGEGRVVAVPDGDSVKFVVNDHYHD